jgi:hypothetical protein
MGLKMSDMFPSSYLGKDDVTPPLRAVIGNIWMDDVQGEDGVKRKPIVSFADAGIKHMILNVTNTSILIDAFGDTDLWIGKVIEIYYDPNVMFGPKRTGGIRLRIPNGPQSQAPAGPASMTYQQAVAACAAVGIIEPDMRAGLKAGGQTTWNPACEALVRNMVQARQQIASSFDTGESLPPEDTIPF